MTTCNRNLEIFASIQFAEDDTREGPGPHRRNTPDL